MEFQIVKRFYSDIQANLYYIRLQEAGISCFLSHENISTILPLSDGGVCLNISKDHIEDGLKLIAKIEAEQEKSKEFEDFRDATKEDIEYEQNVKQYENWLNSGLVDKDFVTSFLFIAFIIVVLIIVINFFFPFLK